jgi:hypothetical protein
VSELEPFPVLRSMSTFGCQGKCCFLLKCSEDKEKVVKNINSKVKQRPKKMYTLVLYTTGLYPENWSLCPRNVGPKPNIEKWDSSV